MLSILSTVLSAIEYEEEIDCHSTPHIGPCRAVMERYYFDKSDRKCKKFIYGGCSGNKNNYLSDSDCNKACKNKSNFYG